MWAKGWRAIWVRVLFVLLMTFMATMTAGVILAILNWIGLVGRGALIPTLIITATATAVLAAILPTIGSRRD